MKPSFLKNNDTVCRSYQVFYYPIRRVDATKPQHLAKVDSKTKVIFSGSNDYGDKIFLEYDGQLLSFMTSSEEVSKTALSLKEGEEIYITLDYQLLTNDSFKNILWPHITKIRNDK